MGLNELLLTMVAALVAVFAVSIGVVGNVAPHLFMSIPDFGFVLWAMTGNEMPPYFSPDAWEESEMKTWIQDGDVVIATGSQSGTTWMLYCGHQIRVKGSDDFEYGDISWSTPWPDFIHTPGSSWSEQKPLMESTMLTEIGKTWGEMWNNPAFPFRVFKSHYTPATLPIKQFPKVKFLAMARNGLDVVASMVPFFDSHTQQFRDVWGGFPPKGSGNVTADAETRMDQMMPGNLLGTLYFDYVKDWWPYRNEPNVLLLHYADAKKDLAGLVTKLAAFYGVDLTEDEHATVVKKCGMEHMKANKGSFSYALPLHPDFVGKRMTKSGVLTRKGVNGQGKEGVNGQGKVIFTAEQKERWAEMEAEQFTEDGLISWARAGGPHST
jgi:hypothetical protein